MHQLRFALLGLLLSLLQACVSSGSTPGSASTGIPEQPPKMLGEIVEDPRAATVPDAWKNWIQANHQAIRTSDPLDTDFSDLQFLKPILGNRRIVQLGESSHGVGTFDAMKARLIRFLHQEMGFEVLAFESCIYQCWDTNERLSSMNGQTAMLNSINGVWWAKETVPLFDYLVSQAGTARPLILAGVDMKQSTGNFVRRPAFLRDVVAKVDPSYAVEVEALDKQYIQAFQTMGYQSFLDAHKAESKAGYTKLITFLDAHRTELDAAYASRLDIPIVARQAAWSIRMTLDYLDEKLPDDRMSGRDLAMADNLEALITKAYPGKKVILWAHNGHIANQFSRDISGMGLFVNSMGTVIADRHRDDLYTIGLYMYRGTTCTNTKRAIAVKPPMPNSLEALFYQAHRKFPFVDLLHAPVSAGTAWADMDLPFWDWGTIENTFRPRAQFDGLLVCDTVATPTYIP